LSLGVEEVRRPGHIVLRESWNEVPILIPYLNPEFIAAILGDKSAIASDMRTDPKSAVENSVPVHRSQSAFNEKPVPAPFQWKCILVAILSLQLAVVAKLIVLWLV
jgi:hypothetical protein